MAYTPDLNVNSAKVPQLLYRVAVMAVKHGLSSKKQTPQSTLNVQIISPDTVELKDGTKVDTGGVSGDMTLYYTEASFKYLFASLAKLGIKPPEGCADIGQFITATQHLVDGLVGQTFEMIVKSEKEPLIDPRTEKPMVDSNGKPVEGYERLKFDSIGIHGNLIALKDLAGGTGKTPY